MKEELLQFIWQHKYLFQFPLITTDGRSIRILKPGTLNSESGPDFFHAQIMLDTTFWAGNIEIHLKSSDWLRHGHQYDKAYNNVILHVVWEDDIVLLNSDFENIPTLVVQPFINEKTLSNYSELLITKGDIPCKKIFAKPAEEIWNIWIERLSIERLETKHESISAYLKEFTGDWEHAFYVQLGKYFGQKTNSLPFEILCKQLPLSLLKKYRSDQIAFQAILFGMAGFLEDSFTDQYLKTLQKEFNYLEKKHTLNKLSKSIWKFGGCRPANFPTLKLFQFASLWFEHPDLFQETIQCKSLKDIKFLLTIQSKQQINIKQLHDMLSDSAPVVVCMSENFMNLLIINSVIPFLLAYSKYFPDKFPYLDSIDWLSEIPAEKNSLLKEWEGLGIHARHAKESQALIQLKNYYCKRNLCLKCAIGNHLLNNRYE